MSLQLPNELWRLIFELSCEFVSDALRLRLVSSTWKDIIEEAAGTRLDLIHEEFYGMLTDPLYEGITDLIPLWKSISRSQVIERQLTRLLTFKNLSKRQLDILLGYMIENQDYFAIILANPKLIDNERQLQIRADFVNYVRSSLLDDDLFRKFLFLAHYQVHIKPEDIRVGISFYFRKYTLPQLFSEPSSFFQRAQAFDNITWLDRVKFLHDSSLREYVVRVINGLLTSIVIDTILAYLVFQYSALFTNHTLVSFLLPIIFMLFSPVWMIIRFILIKFLK